MIDDMPDLVDRDEDLDPSYEDVAKIVARGAKVLDHMFPDWYIEERIDLDSLDLSDPDWCVLGQLGKAHPSGWGSPYISMMERVCAAVTNGASHLLDEETRSRLREHYEVGGYYLSYYTAEELGFDGDVYESLRTAWVNEIERRRGHG